MHKLACSLSIIAALLAGAAVAQEMPTPQVQALSGKLVEEMSDAVNWRARAIAAEDQLRKVQQTLADALKKAEPTQEVPPPVPPPAPAPDKTAEPAK